MYWYTFIDGEEALVTLRSTGHLIYLSIYGYLHYSWIHVLWGIRNYVLKKWAFLRMAVQVLFLGKSDISSKHGCHG